MKIYPLFIYILNVKSNIYIQIYIHVHITCSITIHIHVHHIYNTYSISAKLRVKFIIDTYQNDEINEEYCKPITYTAKKDIKNATTPTKHTEKHTIFVTFYVKIYPILLKTTKTHIQTEKSDIREKFGKKIFRKKFIGSDTPAAKPL